MEKDHFRDRTDEVQYRANIHQGTFAYICTKDMQKSARNISDLTLIKVSSNLTSNPKHPRGQKVKGFECLVDNFGNPLKCSVGDEKVGRCVYLTDETGFSIRTKDGLKTKVKNGDKYSLALIEESGNQLCLKLTCGQYNIYAEPFKHIYFNNQEEMVSFSSTIEISSPQLINGTLFITINGFAISVADSYFFIDGKKQLTSKTNISSPDIDFKGFFIVEY